MTTASPFPSAPVSAPSPASADEVLAFWLGAARPDNAQALLIKQQWFTKSDTLDAQIRARFEPTVQAALAGQLDHWAGDAWSCLALLVLLDQFTRNMYRGTPQAFGGDARALAVAQRAMAQGLDQQLPGVTRIFVYLPLEHAEDLAMQEASVAAFAQLAAAHTGAGDEQAFFAGTLDYAHRHQEVIAQFGRFPHRNAILGRPSTPQERDYLAQPGAGF